jgi:predicted GTPase
LRPLFFLSIKVAAAVANSKVALFVIDAREGVTPIDKHFALWWDILSLSVCTA